MVAGRRSSVADISTLDAMRLPSVRAPEAAHAGLGNAHLARHPAARPVRGSDWLGLSRPGNHCGDHRCRNGPCPSRPWSILHQAFNTKFDESDPPKSRHSRATANQWAISLFPIPSAASRTMRLALGASPRFPVYDATDDCFSACPFVQRWMGQSLRDLAGAIPCAFGRSIRTRNSAMSFPAATSGRPSESQSPSEPVLRIHAGGLPGAT